MSRFIKFLLAIFSTLIFLLIGILMLIFFVNPQNQLNFIFWILLTIYILQILTSFSIFFSKRSFEVKTSWLLALNIPFIGLFAFLTVGLIPFKIKSIKEMRKKREIISQKEDYSYTNEFIEVYKSDPMIAIYNIQESPIYKNNNIMLVDQSNLFEESINLIRLAKKTINIQFYILHNSKWLNLIINELINKSREGIEIKIMFDYIGSYKKHGKQFINALKKNKIEYAIFNSTKFMKIIPNTNFRNHRKGIIIDNKYCLTGGSNIGDEYINLKNNYHYLQDINFIIEGESVNSLSLQFYFDWYNETEKKFLKNKELLNKFNELKIIKSKKPNSIIQILHSEPYSEYKLFQNIIKNYNFKAKKRIWIYTPYFVSNIDYINSLIMSAMEGLDVRIILPGKPDNKKIILTLNRSLYNKLIESNIKIYEYDGFNHSKGILIDDEIVILGSNNLDMRSFFINFETAFIIKSRKINNDIEIKFLNDINNSKLIKFKVNLNLIEKLQIKFLNIFHALL